MKNKIMKNLTKKMFCDWHPSGYDKNKGHYIYNRQRVINFIFIVFMVLVFSLLLLSCHTEKTITTKVVCNEELVDAYVRGCVKSKIQEGDSDKKIVEYVRSCVKEAKLKYCK